MMKHRLILTAVLILLLLCFISAAECDTPFEIKRIGNINPYGSNSFEINSEYTGIINIKIHDSVCIYRILTQDIQPGKNIVNWDGCGYNREKLYEKTYTVTAELETESGDIYSQSFNTPIEFPFQCLQYALPSSECLYLDEQDEWFIEYRTVTDGNVCIEMNPEDESMKTISYSLQAKGGKIARKQFDSFARKTVPFPGKYIVTVYEKTKPEEKFTFPLTVSEGTAAVYPVEATGEIMPDRNMTDEEIWELMMQPSVVVDMDYFKHQDIHETPDEQSKSLGTVHGETQALKVIRIQNQWALIGAWNHEDASYTEGWIPVSRLKTVFPEGKYGILVDKQKQTMTIYENGKIIDTLIVSTGRAEKNRLYQETSAGCFLTGFHRVNFSMNGKKYDYVIQYDGGNLLHQTPYDWGHQKKDFTLGRAYLGTKASHACIRIQPEPGEGGLNAFWLFTHIPYHTRVIILDDPEEREAAVSKVSRDKKEDICYDSLKTVSKLESRTENDIVLTFGGSVLSGGSGSNRRKNGNFLNYVDEKGYDKPLSGMQKIFGIDDLTCVSLECPITEADYSNAAQKQGKTANDGMEEILKNQSVEMIRIISDSVWEAGEEAVRKTAEKTGLYSSVLQRDRNIVLELKSHLFGFAGCSEKEYLDNPEIIDLRICELKEQKCEKIILCLSWNRAESSGHSIVQEAMAHRGIRAGADLVIGNHPDAVQGIDYLEGVPVIYSLGQLLDGSKSSKPKSQQGILIRAVFSFKEPAEPVSLTVIPIMPYGNQETEKNEYCPSAELSIEEAMEQIRYIWNDTADTVMKKTAFYLSDQL